MIGVTASVHGSRIAWWANRLALHRAGASAVRITACASFPIGNLDGLVVGGGDDIDAALYGETARPHIRIDPERDRLEMGALDCAALRGIPVLGICRGSQMINVHRGGSLYVDIHEVYEQAPRMRTVLPRKRIRIEPDSRLYRILGIAECRVNALHHQAVDRLGDGLDVVARERAGVVQGIEAPGHRFLMGVQWHPEYLVLDQRQQGLFRALVAAVTGEVEEGLQEPVAPTFPSSSEVHEGDLTSSTPLHSAGVRLRRSGSGAIHPSQSAGAPPNGWDRRRSEGG